MLMIRYSIYAENIHIQWNPVYDYSNQRMIDLINTFSLSVELPQISILKHSIKIRKLSFLLNKQKKISRGVKEFTI